MAMNEVQQMIEEVATANGLGDPVATVVVTIHAYESGAVSCDLQSQRMAPSISGALALVAARLARRCLRQLKPDLELSEADCVQMLPTLAAEAMRMERLLDIERVKPCAGDAKGGA